MEDLDHVGARRPAAGNERGRDGDGHAGERVATSSQGARTLYRADGVSSPPRLLSRVSVVGSAVVAGHRL